MISVKTDIANLILQKTLNYNTLELNNAINCMTTGYKVNHAKDNVAGYSIINNLSSKISSMLQIQQNIDDGVNLLQTAEGGLDNILDLLAKIRALAVIASNGTYNSQSREAMQQEADAYIDQIKYIKNNTEFNKMNLYEVPKTENESEPPVTPINLSELSLFNTGETFDTSNSPSLTLEDELCSSSNVSFLSLDETPQINAAPGIMLFAASPTIDGAVSFTGSQVQTIVVDGIQYKITNRATTTNDLSYSKNTTTGEITFLGSNFKIEAQLDIAHNIIISGRSNYVYGGNLDDTITELNSASCSANYIYGKDGDDTIISRGSGSRLYGEAGNDTITAGNYNYVYGGADNDTINLTSYWYAAEGGDGNDTFNISANSTYTVRGQGGDDTFNFIGTRSGVLVDGGSGTNTVTGNVGTANTTMNVVGANGGLISLVKNVSQTININGKNYTFSTTSNTAEIAYKVESSG